MMTDETRKDSTALAIFSAQYTVEQGLIVGAVSLTDNKISEEKFNDGSIKVGIEGTNLFVGIFWPEAGVATFTLCEYHEPKAFKKWANGGGLLEACKWLVNLAHGQGKFGPSTNKEYEEAVRFAEREIDLYEQL